MRYTCGTLAVLMPCGAAQCLPRQMVHSVRHLPHFCTTKPCRSSTLPTLVLVPTALHGPSSFLPCPHTPPVESTAHPFICCR
jgi:hypothetical protein